VTAAQFIAGGVDPERSAVFCQSHVTEHAELGWVMNCLTADGEARRMTQFKDKVAKGQNANVGLLTYPMLMAADILMYDAAYVPVGEDQRQHLEITRDLAERFNTRYAADTLVVPEPYIVKESAKIMDLQDPTSKMSKTGSSPKGLIDLMDAPARIAKNIRSAVTDAEAEVRYDPETKAGVSNLLVIHSTLSGASIADLESRFAGQGYGALKGEVADVVVAAVEPFQTRLAELLADPAELDRLLALGADRARTVAQATMARVRSAVGLLPAVREVH
jgi:tryptophanyl-tRNA synthetase